MLWRSGNRGWVLALGAVLLLAGCFGGGDEPAPGGSDGQDDGQEAAGPEGREQEAEADASPWTETVSFAGSVESQLCMMHPEPLPGFCAFHYPGDHTLSVMYNNATVAELEVIVTWDEEWSVEDRTLTLSCDDSEGGDCTGFEEPVRETGGTPLTMTVPDYGLPQNTTVNLTVEITNPLPEPFFSQMDGEHDFELEATLRLEPTS